MLNRFVLALSEIDDCQHFGSIYRIDFELRHFGGQSLWLPQSQRGILDCLTNCIGLRQTHLLQLDQCTSRVCVKFNRDNFGHVVEGSKLNAGQVKYLPRSRTVTK